MCTVFCCAVLWRNRLFCSVPSEFGQPSPNPTQLLGGHPLATCSSAIAYQQLLHALVTPSSSSSSSSSSRLGNGDSADDNDDDDDGDGDHGGEQTPLLLRQMRAQTRTTMKIHSRDGWANYMTTVFEQIVGLGRRSRTIGFEREWTAYMAHGSTSAWFSSFSRLTGSHVTARKGELEIGDAQSGTGTEGRVSGAGGGAGGGDGGGARTSARSVHKH